MNRMMDDQQYFELQQINDFWSTSYDHYTPSYKGQEVNFSTDDNIYVDNYDNGMVSMQPMQRWWHDQSTFTPGMLHANVHINGQRHFEQQWPAADFQRNVSPDRTSASGLSSYATQSEHRSPRMYHAAPYGSPTDCSQPLIAYPSVEIFHGGAYPAQSPPLSAVINPRDTEYEHPEPESVIEDAEDLDMEQPTPCDHADQTVKLEATPPCSTYADSGIGHSVRDAESVQPEHVFNEPASDSEYTPSTKPTGGKRRRSSASNSGSARPSRRRSSGRKDSAASNASNTHKVTKKTRKASISTKGVKDTTTRSDQRSHFPCPFTAYGCSSTFSSKNEWKRHVSTQHIKQGFWRCDLCPTTTDANDQSAQYFNDFNRKDLFTQHLRRMHAAPKDASSRNHKGYPVNENNLSEHQKRCFMTLRAAPQQSNCLFCDRTFDGPTSWEERIEHVGRHLEKDRKCEVDMLDCRTWLPDTSLQQYLIDEGLITNKHGQWNIGDGKSRRRSALTCEEDSEED